MDSGILLNFNNGIHTGYFVLFHPLRIYADALTPVLKR